MSDPWKAIEQAKLRFAIACGLGDDVDARRAASSALDAAIRAALAAPPAEAQESPLDRLVREQQAMGLYDDAAPLAEAQDTERLRWIAEHSMYAAMPKREDGTRTWLTPEIFFDGAGPSIDALREAIDSFRSAHDAALAGTKEEGDDS
jgi:hypothetical protein